MSLSKWIVRSRESHTAWERCARISFIVAAVLFTGVAVWSVYFARRAEAYLDVVD